jgi:hypothetical protein
MGRGGYLDDVVEHQEIAVGGQTDRGQGDDFQAEVEGPVVHGEFMGLVHGIVMDHVFHAFPFKSQDFPHRKPLEGQNTVLHLGRGMLQIPGLFRNCSITQGSRTPKKNIWIPTFVGMT